MSSTSTKDISDLLLYLKSGHTPHWYDDSTRWRAALTALVAERDEARREACHLEAVRSSFLGFQKNIKDLAAQRGWDCFKEGGGA